MLVPCSGCCCTPWTMVGSGSPATSSTVAAMSITWVELGAELPSGLDALGPVDDGAVAGAAPVGGDLLGPLVRGVHGMGPADRVVVVGLRPAELVDPRRQELRCLQMAEAAEGDHLVEGPLQRPLGGGAVVPDDQVDQRLI